MREHVDNTAIEETATTFTFHISEQRVCEQLLNSGTFFEVLLDSFGNKVPQRFVFNVAQHKLLFSPVDALANHLVRVVHAEFASDNLQHS